MPRTVFIDGHAGTTGLGIAERLSSVPGVVLREIGEAERKSPQARAAAIQASDLVIICLPDDAARESAALAAALGDEGPKVLDASSAHRTARGWAYGFAEMAPGQAERIRKSARVSNPGCYATGAVALLHPLVELELLPPDAPLSIHAVSGYSGGGKAMIAAHERDGGPAFSLYALDLQHKHVPEIVAHSGLTRSPIFVPSVAHLRQGMIVSIPLHRDFLAAGTTPALLREALADWYAGASQVRVVAPDAGARLQADGMSGSDVVELTVFEHPGGDQALLVARLDNLGKGASGAAVQNAKLMLGLPA